MTIVYGINQKTMWAVFSPDGDVQVRTITDRKKEAKELAIGYHELGETTWDDYATAGYTVHKIIVDIKIV